jgi:hypothetical protein
MRDARTRWARVTLARLVRLGGLVWVMGALRGWRSPARERRCASDECGGDVGAGKRGIAGDRPVQPRISNFAHYAVIGVKAQAFVLVLFELQSFKRKLYQ